MKNFGVIFFDIDGTLAYSKTDIKSEMAELLSELSQKNRIALITGGNFEIIIDYVIEKLPKNTNLNNIFLLPTSGGGLYTYENNYWHEVYKNCIPEYRVPEIADLIRKAFKDSKIPIPRKTYGEKLEYRGPQITFSALGQEAPYEKKNKWDPKHEKRAKIVKKLTKWLPDFQISIGGTNSIDITAKGIDKAFGIKELCNYLEIKVEDCVFVGDAIFKDGNDSAVLKTNIKTISTRDPEETLDIIKDLIENREYQPRIWTNIKRFFRKILDPIFQIIKTEKFPYKNNKKEKPEAYLTRSLKNPVLGPTAYSWENEGVFNPAAIYLGGRVHILYRALGSNGMSTIGYASSENGIDFDERLTYPIYYPKADFEIDPISTDKKYDRDKYCSGGGWTGCEDPKICQIGERLFLTYVAFSGWHSVRIAMSSILVDDFLNKKWNWTKPILCTKKDVISKSGGLFPEKIKGKYVFFQRIFPNILIDYLDNLRFDTGEYPEGEFQISPSKEGWDSRKISFGATPIRTKYGWLVITHGVDDAADHQYHLGAMILDYENPERIIYRSAKPFLSPDMWYENDWKPGVVYPCGAINKDGTLLVYYGGGDKYVCVASAPFDQFVESLMHNEIPKIEVKKVRFKKKNV